MSQLWQTCLPCKHSLNTFRLLAQHGITTHPGISRLRLHYCLTPFSLGCWQARCFMFNTSHLQHCLLKPTQQRMDTLTTAKDTSEGYSEDLKQPVSPSAGKRPHSENCGEKSSQPVDDPPLNWKVYSQSQTTKCFRMDAHLHPQLLNCYVQQTSTTTSQTSFHTSAGSSNELKLNKSATEEKRKDELTPELMAKQMRRLRHWESVATEKPGPGQEFSLMSYNILAQRLLEDNDVLYRHCDPEILSWKHRGVRILEELVEANADIVCLQEVQEDHLESTLMPRLQKYGYVGLYKKRTGDKSDGCAIFFKKDMFGLEGWLPVEFNKPGVYVLNRDNIGIVALFRPLKGKSDARLCVATTHLLFNPRRGDVKLAQLQVLFAEMDRLAFRKLSSSGRPLYHPVIVCGDMNSEPLCEIYKFMSSGSLHYEGLPIATLSGQEEGYGRTKHCLSPELLPPYLGITDHCQFAKIQAERICNCRFPQECEQASSSIETTRDRESSSSSESVVCIDSPEADNQSSSLSDKLYISPVFSSGVMRHKFNLLSVYNHRLSRRPHDREVTTQHSRASCTVDYIFYSVKKKNVCVEDGRVIHKNVSEMDLKLLSRYSLVSGKEVMSLGGLPNAVCPSDHLPLVAKFSLDL